MNVKESKGWGYNGKVGKEKGKGDAVINYTHSYRLEEHLCILFIR